MNREMRGSGRIFGAVALFMLLFSSLPLTGCSTGDPNDPNLGMYKAVSIVQLDENGKEQPMDEEKVSSLSLELSTLGRAYFHINGDKSVLNWSVKDGIITLSSSREVVTGTIEDGVIKVTFNGLSLELKKSDETQEEMESDSQSESE